MKNKTLSIWTSSPCTIGYPQRKIVLQKSQRFGVHSIYHHQKIESKQKVKLQIIRPQTCLIQFRRKIQQCQKYSRKCHRKSKSQALLKKIDQNTPPVVSRQNKINQKLVQRLTFTQKIQVDKIFDRNGIRSTFYTALNGQQSIRYSFKKGKTIHNSSSALFKGPKVYVSGTTRIDLSKPQNFNPGPGSYFLDKRDNQQISQLYQKAHKSLTKKFQEQNTFQNDNKSTSEKSKTVFFQQTLAKMKSKVKKSRLNKVSTAYKSRTQFPIFSRDL